jgi:cobaltochelatase CobN
VGIARLLVLAGILLAVGAAQATSVLFVTSSPVQPAKFRLLEAIAAPLGVKVEARFAEKLPQEVGAMLFAGHDLVFFDSPRDHLREFVARRLAKALPGLEVPHLWLHDTNPEWRGIPDGLARRLHAYYVNGGRANFDGFFRTVAAHRAGRPLDGIAEPVVFPKSAVYHPRAPRVVFPDAASYLAWAGPAAAQGSPVVAVAMHQQYIAAEQLAFIDHLVARIEAAGAVPLVFYSPVMDANAIRAMTSAGGRPLADVLVNTQIMLNPEGRRKEFEALGIPVVQAMPYRKGDEAAWEADPHGVALMDVPFYLAQAEYAGVTDIQIAAATRRSDDQVRPIVAQADAVVAKALNLAKLRRKDNADKRVAVLYWNYPPGEKNLSASFLNVPRSLVSTLDALRAAGYRTETPAESTLVNLLQRLLAPTYRDGELEGLLRDGLAEAFPVADYEAWLAGLPARVRDDLHARWGAPAKSAMVVRRDGKAFFVIPRVTLGNVTILPQPPRGERWDPREKALYHSTKASPSHFYLAAYLWAREAPSHGGFGADAFVHFGTHGSQEWLPGKERGLSVSDYPMLAVGDVPVVYPYIVDNIGESLQAKRRGRAVIVSHQTPPFAPAGLHDELNALHDLLHQWLQQDEGAVREKIGADLVSRARRLNVDRDMGWEEARIRRELRAFVDALHDHLHELAQAAQPLGLHTLGRPPEERLRVGTALLMLGKPFWEAAAAPGEEADESFVGDYRRLEQATPYRLLLRHAVAGEPVPAHYAPAVKAGLEKARGWYRDLGAAGELEGLVAALAGRYIPTSYGGDPMKNPDALPTGRNLYGFDPSRIPTPQAWAAGKEAMESLLAAHRAKAGAAPQKLALSLWSVETMRHQGLLEAQALWAMGVEPVWDAGGRVADVRLVPREALGRPRVDVVLSATGLYRDHFPNAMRQLAKAASLASQADEPDNPVFRNAVAIAASLEAKGLPPEAARKAGRTRIFSSESGRYGTGLDEATLATDTWKGKAEGDRKLANLYLSRMQFAYGPDEADWGRAGERVNLYAEHLKGTQGAVLSRTSNLYGMLTTDDPFQYLGGLALAVRHLDGKAPELYISNLRGSGGGRVEGAAGFLAKELATRNFHPGFVKGLMAEGYAGTLQVLDGINNFSGWQVVAREIVRDDQWQEFVEVYVRDKHGLGLRAWFERENPHALAQSIERMLEAARQGYWEADPAVVAELRERYRDLARRFDVRSDNAAFAQFVDAPPVRARGFGLDVPSPAAPEQVAALPPLPAIRGQRLEPVEIPVVPRTAPVLAAMLAALALATFWGMGSAARQARPIPS